MPDCYQCLNDWPTLEDAPLKTEPARKVCRNCARSQKQVIAFYRRDGLDITKLVYDSQATGDEPPQAPPAKTAKKPS
jgi:hypothetical protein